MPSKQGDVSLLDHPIAQELLYAGYTVWTIISFHPGQFTTGLDALLFFSLILTTVLAQVYRYRRVSILSQRQQTKWVVFAFSFTIVGFIILLTATHFLFPPGNSTSIFGKLIHITIVSSIFLLIPGSIAIAVLRSRLWDIDIIINKALVYGLLTGILILVYVGLIFAVQFLLRGSSTSRTMWPSWSRRSRLPRCSSLCAIVFSGSLIVASIAVSMTRPRQ